MLVTCLDMNFHIIRRFREIHGIPRSQTQVLSDVLAIFWVIYLTFCKLWLKSTLGITNISLQGQYVDQQFCRYVLSPILGTEEVFNKLYFYVYLNAIQVDPLMKDVLLSDYKISLMKNPATYNTKIINENSLSFKLCTCQPFSFSLPVDAEACLPVLVSASPENTQRNPGVLMLQ